MSRLIRLRRNMLFLMCATCMVACDPQTNEETAGAEDADQNVTQSNQTSKSNNPDENYTTADRNAEPARSIAETRQDMDVVTPEDPVMAYAHYHTVEFKHGVAQLTNDEQDDLREFISSLEKDQPLYVTVRMQDADALDVTEPDPEFKKLTDMRVSQVMDVLERGDIEIAELKVDESGISETPGEGRALARPENGRRENGEQLVVITIEAEENGEPSDTIPHSPNPATLEG